MHSNAYNTVRPMTEKGIDHESHGLYLISGNGANIFVFSATSAKSHMPTNYPTQLVQTLIHTPIYLNIFEINQRYIDILDQSVSGNKNKFGVFVGISGIYMSPLFQWHFNANI